MFREMLRLWLGIRSIIRHLPPAQLTLLGYASYIFFGWILLCLPQSQRYGNIGVLDHLFMSTSAITTTGLVTIDPGENYSFSGQLIILLLMQIGGIGYMTLSSFVALAGSRTLSKERIEIARTVFSLPRALNIAHFLRAVILFTISVEICGAMLLYSAYSSAGVADALWHAVFHSVSAFCTAGFSLNSDSFVSYAGNFWINAILTVLSLLGAIGFIVFLDYWNLLTGRVNRLTLTTKIIMHATLITFVIGTVLLLLGEPSLQLLPLDRRLMVAAFQSMSAFTTVGFNSVDLGSFSNASILVLVSLMIVGSSPSGTGGGLKCTSVTILFAIVRAVLRGEKEFKFMNFVIPYERVFSAVASAGFYLSIMLGCTYLLELTEKSDFEQNLFEAASALGTVGLSLGITSSLSSIGKLIVIFLMFFGRMGPLTFGMAFFRKNENMVVEKSSDDIAI